MEGVGARLGRSSTRYGPATVFTGPVRRWKKKWVHITPPTTTAAAASNNNNNHHHHQAIINSNGNSSSNGTNDNASHLMLFKWTPIAQNQNAADSNSNGDAKEEGTGSEVDEGPPRRKIKYIPIALLEEQKKESSEDHIDETVETDPNVKPEADEVNGKPDINDVPMDENEASEETNVERQDLNESTLDLNARDGDEDSEESKEQAQ